MGLSEIEFVLTKKNYLIVFLAVTALTFAGLYYLMVATTSGQRFEIFVLMNGVVYASLSLLASLAISVLLGTYAALTAFKFNALRKAGVKQNASSLAGVVAAVFGTGCPTCGSLVFGLFGAPLALLAMPFQGLELKVLSVALLAASVFTTSKSLEDCKECRVQL